MTTTPLNQGPAALRYVGVGADKDFRRYRAGPGRSKRMESVGASALMVPGHAAEISTAEGRAPPFCTRRVIHSWRYSAKHFVVTHPD